jgi:hypothetical protein
MGLDVRVRLDIEILTLMARYSYDVVHAAGASYS